MKKPFGLIFLITFFLLNAFGCLFYLFSWNESKVQNRIDWIETLIQTGENEYKGSVTNWQNLSDYNRKHLERDLAFQKKTLDHQTVWKFLQIIIAILNFVIAYGIWRTRRWVNRWLLLFLCIYISSYVYFSKLEVSISPDQIIIWLPVILIISVMAYLKKYFNAKSLL